MPTYDYLCEACGAELEIFQSMQESPKRKCPECGRLRLRRKIGGGAGILFKGSGFYETDYRSESYRKGSEAEKKGAEAAPSGGTEKKADAPKKDAGAKKAGGKGDKGKKSA